MDYDRRNIEIQELKEKEKDLKTKHTRLTRIIERANDI